MSLTGNWSYPTAIKFGAGRIQELAAACAQAGIKKPLLVTDKGLATLPVTQSTLDILEAAGLGRAMFSEVDPNPNEKNLEAGVAVYKAGGHDGVIAFGGGSGLDLGKMVAFMASLGEKPFRARQLLKWIHGRGVDDFAAMTDIGKALRTRLSECAQITPPQVVSEHGAADGVRKWLMRMPGGSLVETVLPWPLPWPSRRARGQRSRRRQRKQTRQQSCCR